GVQWKFDKTGRDSLKVGVYANRFGEFITLRRSGLTRDSEGNGAAGSVTDCGDGTSRESACSATILPEFRYQGVRARLAGFEIEATWRALDGPHALDLELKSDLTRADDRSHGEPLPRIAPLRLRGAAAWTHGPWAARVEFDHAARQSRVPASDTVGATPAFTLWNAALTYRAGWGGNNALLFVKATNIGDRLAYNASSIDTIRALAPLPGRALKAGVQLTF
ncbi:MAG TPA: TonB-dependent receptor, partial [Usitatibacteraceae bacterium]|nr:TonB-dependent receptor [Usitatibacteraceae bacterium]